MIENEILIRMRDLARRLISFNFPEDQTREATVRSLENNRKTHNVYCNFAGFEVRISIFGRQWLFGRTRNIFDAIRLADMALFNFWKYRRRGGNRPINESDLNLGLESVQRDFAECPDAVALINSYEKLFIDSGMITSSTGGGSFEVSQARKLLLTEWDQMKRTLQGVKSLLAQHPPAQMQLTFLSEAEAELGKLIKSVDQSFFAPGVVEAFSQSINKPKQNDQGTLNSAE